MQSPSEKTEIPNQRSNNEGSVKAGISQIVNSQFKTGGSPIKKVLAEASKIIKIGMAKEIALYEKEAAINNSNETIDNLRRNILQLQMEYEKLDQNYQNEVCYRTEIIKRMDTTRSIVESAAEYSNILANSVRQLEEDKLRLAEFYELIITSQKDVEDKYKIVEKRVEEIDDFIKLKFDEVKSVHEKMTLLRTEALTERDKELSAAMDNLKIIKEEKENLKENVEKLKSDINNLSDGLKARQEIISLQYESLNKLKISLKTLKVKNFESQKLWKIKKKELGRLRKKYKSISQRLRDTQISFNQSLTSNSALEGKKNELQSKMQEQIAFFQAEQTKWELKNDELMKALNLQEKRNEELFSIKNELNEKLQEFERKTSELMEKEETDKANSNQLQENYLMVLDENRLLKANNSELNKDNQKNAQLLLDFQSKLNKCDNDLKSEKSVHEAEVQNLQTLAKNLTEKVALLEEKLLLEQAENKKIFADYEKGREDGKSLLGIIEDLQKAVQEKASEIDKLRLEKEENMQFIQTLQNKVQDFKNVDSHREAKFAILNEDYGKMVSNNEELRQIIKNEQENRSFLKSELDDAKKHITELNYKLNDENILKEALITERDRLQKNIEDLRKAIKEKESAAEALRLAKTNAEEALANYNEIQEDNSTLKSSVTDLKCRLEGAEARVEAFKVVIKKLEAEKMECKEKQYQEIAKLKAEMTILQDSIKKGKENFRTLNVSQRFDEHSDKETDLPGIKKLWDKVRESTSFQRIDAKENPLGNLEGELQPQGSSTPLFKKFLSTPRKILTSTPQPRLQSLTPTKKNKDPYEFESDGSDERLNADQTPKRVASRSKKESACKRAKRKNFV